MKETTMTSRKKTNDSVWGTDPVASMLQRIHYKHITRNMRSFSVLSQKSSEGKTTLAFLLGRGLNDVYGLKVLLVDINPEGDDLVGQYMDQYPSKNGFTIGHNLPFSIFRLKNLEIEWSKNMFDNLYLNQLIDSFNQFDIVIVDTVSKQNENDSTLKVKTDACLIVQSERSVKEDQQSFLDRNKLSKKDIIGVIFNK